MTIRRPKFIAALIRRPKFTAAFTLLEVMMATVILTVAALGALSHQYHTAQHAHIAEAQITATRTAQLLLEDWKGAGGVANYNPASLGLGFSTSSVQPENIQFVMSYNEMGTMLNGTLQSTTIDDVPMTILLAWKVIDTEGSIQLKQLSVITKWAHSSGTTPIILTTYVRVDTSGG